jgi:hypothetical protein
MLPHCQDLSGRFQRLCASHGGGFNEAMRGGSRPLHGSYIGYSDSLVIFGGRRGSMQLQCCSSKFLSDKPQKFPGKISWHETPLTSANGARKSESLWHHARLVEEGASLSDRYAGARRPSCVNSYLGTASLGLKQGEKSFQSFMYAMTCTLDPNSWYSWSGKQGNLNLW